MYVCTCKIHVCHIKGSLNPSLLLHTIMLLKILHVCAVHTYVHLNQGGPPCLNCELNYMLLHIVTYVLSSLSALILRFFELCIRGYVGCGFRGTLLSLIHSTTLFDSNPRGNTAYVSIIDHTA